MPRRRAMWVVRGTVDSGLRALRRQPSLGRLLPRACPSDLCMLGSPLRMLPLAQMIQRIVQREYVSRIIGFAPEDHPRPTAHSSRRIPFAVHVELIAVDRPDENALVLGPRQHSLRE